MSHIYWGNAEQATASSIKTVNALARASIKILNTLALANMKTRNGLA